MTIKRKHECNPAASVSYKHLELSKRIPTHTEIYKCISYFSSAKDNFQFPWGISLNVSIKKYFQFQYSVKAESDLNFHNI